MRAHTMDHSAVRLTRRSKVMAEVAVREKRFADAARAYEDATKIALWSPELHFNAALMLAEIHYYDEAIDEMKKYVKLVPDSPDARAAQDKVYEWEGRGNP
jgi:tetratricopeptide (TPR) repeat protein